MRAPFANVIAGFLGVALWTAPAPMASAQLGLLGKLAAKAGKGAAKAGKAGKLATGAKAATGLKALAVGSLAVSEARAGRLFASLGDEAAAGASYVTRHGDDLRVMRPDASGGLKSESMASISEVSEVAGDVYVDTPAQLAVKADLALPKRAFALAADGSAHPIRQRVDGEGVVQYVVDRTGDVAMELGQFGLDQALNQEQPGAVDERVLQMHVLASADCRRQVQATMPWGAEVQLVAGDGSAEAAAQVVWEDTGKALLLLAEPEVAIEPLLQGAVAQGHDLTALQFSEPCDVPAMRDNVARIVTGRRAGQRAPLLASEPFHIDYLDTSDGVVARGRPATEASSLAAAAWVAHTGAEAVEAALAGEPEDEGGAPAWFVWLIMAIGTVVMGWKTYRFFGWLRGLFTRKSS